jgi:hypothetical protein
MIPARIIHTLAMSSPLDIDPSLPAVGSDPLLVLVLPGGSAGVELEFSPRGIFPIRHVNAEIGVGGEFDLLGRGGCA